MTPKQALRIILKNNSPTHLLTAEDFLRRLRLTGFEVTAINTTNKPSAADLIQERALALEGRALAQYEDEYGDCKTEQWLRLAASELRRVERELRGEDQENNQEQS